MESIIVFGASGGTGKEVVEQSLKAGYKVTAVVRDIDCFNIRHASLKIIAGNVLQIESFADAVAGASVVISCIGSGSTKPTQVYSRGIENIMSAMHIASAKRLICLSAGGLDVNPSNNFIIRFLTKYVLQRILKQPYSDMRIMEEKIKGSDLNYTIIRPPRLLNTPLTRIYRVAINQNLENTGSIARADLAHYIINHLTDGVTFKSTVHLAY